jgi:ABC-type glycerol-3-phosphate transport system substrate-binding protein
MTNLKKVLAILMCAVMLFTLVACTTTGTGNPTDGTTTAPSGNDSTEGTDYPDYVTAPITIEYWHNHGGNLGTWITEKTKEFNETNKYGITVIETNQGGYGDILSKLKSSYGTVVSPTLAIVGAGGIEELASANVGDIPTVDHQGAFADLAAYVERDGYDLENIPEGLRYYMQHYEGKVIEFPFMVSTTLIIYNKAFYSEAPTSMEEWVKMASKISKENEGVYGMGMWMDTGFQQRPVIKSLGAPGLCTADGTGPAAELLGEKSVLRTYLADWKSWIDDGFCHPLSTTDAANNIQNGFYNGTVASFAGGSGVADWTKRAEEAGIEIGFAPTVGYGGLAGGLGGGGFAVMSDATQQEVAAAWEYMKFLLTDENQVEKMLVSGYLPFTYTALEAQALKDALKEQPGYEVAFKALDSSTYNDWSLKLSAWRTEVGNVFTGVLIDGSLTVDQAIEQLEKQATVIFS